MDKKEIERLYARSPSLLLGILQIPRVAVSETQTRRKARLCFTRQLLGIVRKLAIPRGARSEI